jgi:hypothetical protein
MYRGIAIKSWIIKELSPFGWTALISRALPELLEYNPRFSAYYVNKHTKWSQMEVDIIQYYLTKLHGKQIPTDFLFDNLELPVDYFELVGFNFMDVSNKLGSLKKAVLKFFSA